MKPVTEPLLPDTKTPDSSSVSNTQLVAVDIKEPSSVPAKPDAVTSVRADEKPAATKSWVSKKEYRWLILLILLAAAAGLIMLISYGLGDAFSTHYPSPFKYMSGQDEAFATDAPATRFCLYNLKGDTKTYSRLTATVKGITEDFTLFTSYDAIPITAFGHELNSDGTTSFDMTVPDNSPIASGAANSIRFVTTGDYHPWEFTDVTVDGRPCDPVSGDTETHDAYYACGFWTDANTPPNTNQVPQPVSASGLAMVAASTPIVDSKLEASGNALRFN